MKQGLIYVFTGEGKGKTSAALGVATRALLLEKKVVWISFYKEESWGMAEKGLREKFDNLEMQFVGRGFFISTNNQAPNYKQITNSNDKIIKTATVGNKGTRVVDKATREEHKRVAEEGLKLVENKLKEKPFLLVIDEVLNAVSEGLITEEEVIRVVGVRGKTHIVMTGRGSSKKIIEVADLVTECKKIKHPYDKGNLAVRGLDY